jgi:calcineurin-like phosphoesterase family protein
VLVNLSHFPYDGDSHGDDRYSELRLEDRGVPLIHGHTHNPNQKATVSNNGTPQFHVGWDAWLEPVPETRIVEWLESL